MDRPPQSPAAQPDTPPLSSPRLHTVGSRLATFLSVSVDRPSRKPSRTITSPLLSSPVTTATTATTATTTTTNGPEADGEPTYRPPVEMSGWVHKYQSRLRTKQVRRYFRLHNSVLSNHPQLTGGATWDLSVSKCIVRTCEDKCMVTVRLPDKEVRFQLATVVEMDRWAEAIRSGAVCNIEDFYRMGEQLGCGSFGAVRVAFDVATGDKRAVKIVERSSNAKELEFVQRETNVLLSIRHENIVRTYDIFDERDKIYFVMDFVAGGDLFTYMQKRRNLPEMQGKEVLWQTLHGIAYLHTNHIVHRDIKPENILVASVDPLRIKLTDFGFANFIDPLSAAPATDMKSMVGTGCYMAPEVMDGRGHGTPVDIFAAGVVLFRMLGGRLPFRGMDLHECYKQVVAEKADFNTKEWRGVSAHAKSLCRAMLAADPRRRPSCNQALESPWFRDDPTFMASPLVISQARPGPESTLHGVEQQLAPKRTTSQLAAGNLEGSHALITPSPRSVACARGRDDA